MLICIVLRGADRFSEIGGRYTVHVHTQHNLVIENENKCAQNVEVCTWTKKLFCSASRQICAMCVQMQAHERVHVCNVIHCVAWQKERQRNKQEKTNFYNAFSYHNSFEMF